MACEAIAGLFRPFLSLFFSTCNNKHYSIGRIFGLQKTFFWAERRTMAAPAVELSHTISASAAEKLDSQESLRGPRWLRRLAHFGFHEKRKHTERGRHTHTETQTERHTHRFHTHILHCQSVEPPGCHRVKMAGCVLSDEGGGGRLVRVRLCLLTFRSSGSFFFFLPKVCLNILQRLCFMYIHTHTHAQIFFCSTH